MSRKSLRSVRVLPASLLLFAACAPQWTHPPLMSPGNPGTVYVCIDLPHQRMPAALEAIDRWDLALGRWVHIAAAPPGSPECAYWVYETTKANPESPYALAWAAALGGREIFMRKGYYEQDVAGILAHELGHVFGAQHVPSTLMDPVWQPGAYNCPDKTTVAQVAAWNAVPIELLSWCY